MRFTRYYYKKLLLWFFNKKHFTKIHSTYASTKAIYGKSVLISEGTVIADNVTIGDYSYVNKNSYIENCNIGKFCSISSGVYICPFEHDYSLKTTHPIVRWGESAIERPKVNIGNDVLISLNAILLEGITIGDGAVIGAGAVVTKDVKPYEIVGGVPAKLIKYRFSCEVIEYMKNLKWWDWDIQKIRNNIEFLKGKSNIVND